MSLPATVTGRFVSLAGRLGTARYAAGEPAIGRVFCADRTHGSALGGRVSWYAGSGRATDLAAAAAAAAGEAYERYCLRDLDDSRLLRAAAGELTRAGRRFVPPAVLAPVPEPGLERTGIRLRPPPGPTEPLLWVRAAELATGEEVLLPAQYCLYLDHRSAHRPGPVEQPWCLATSNGTAAATGPAGARLGGLLELLERDAFMLMWYHRLRFPFLRLEPGTRLHRRITGLFGPSRIELRLIDLTEVHRVPVVVAVGRGRVSGRPVFAIGGGSALDPATAVWKAARELAGLYGWARQELLEGHRGPITADRIALYGDHLAYYTDPTRHRALDFLFADRPTVAAPCGPAADPAAAPADDRAVLTALAADLRRRDIHGYAVELTPAGAEPFGLRVAKVVSPELMPLDYNHRARHLSRPRLLTEPTRRGWRPDQPTLADLNHDPHPFP